MKRIRRWCRYESVICTMLFDPTYKNPKRVPWHLWMAVVNGLGLNRPYSRMLCRLGFYEQYQPGVCGYCGKRHVKLGKKWAWAVRDTCDPNSPIICIPRGSVS